MMTRSGKSRGILRLLAILALVGLLAGLAPSGGLAANGSDGFYESNVFGFTVEWDDSIWTGEPIPFDGEVTEGLSVNSPLTWGNIRASAWPEVDEEACLEYMAESFDGAGEMKRFRRAPRSMEMPTDVLGGEQGLYTFAMDDNDGSVEMVMYLQCVSFAEDQAALMVMLATTQPAYENELPAWNDLLAGIVPGDGPLNLDSGGDEEADGAGYHNEELGFSVTWDDSVWTGTEIEEENGIGVEFEDELSYGLVKGFESSDLTPEECVSTLASAMEESDAFKRVRKAPDDMERIETDPSATGELYTMLSTASPTRVVVYFECRELPNPDYMLVVHLNVTANDYEEEMPNWQALVDGISVDEETGARDSSSRKQDSSGATFTGVNHDFTVQYDDRIWTAEESTDEGYDWLGLSSDYGSVTILATKTQVDLQGCIDTLLEDEYEYAKGNIERAPRSLDRPQTARDAEGELYAYESVTEESEAVDTLVYFDCRTIEEGQSLIAVTFVTTPELYEEALPEIEALLNSIEIG